MEDFRERIVVDPEICHGKPTIRGTRVMVANIIGGFAAGGTLEDALRGYPRLGKEDVYAALRYAAEVIDNVKLPPQRIPQDDLHG
jgi:uncharacterized protein (DUF433 family)